MFPTLSQYNRTIQQQGSTAFRTLTNLFFIPARTLPIKIYSFGSGSFAVVFKALENNKEVAIRCFIGIDNDYVESYRKIDNYLKNINESWKINIQFLDNEIMVDGKYYPVLKMDWVDGKLLNKYIDTNIYDKNKLCKLQSQFVNISRNLEKNKIAHGDIQESNIIIRENNGLPIVKLIDYDGMFIPDFKGKKQTERGRSEYQHPNRSTFEFNEKIDRFSFWVILCTLEALKFDTTLWKEIMQGGFNTLSNMLFAASDFSNPKQSKLFERLSNLNQPSLNFYIDNIKLALNSSKVKALKIYEQGQDTMDIKFEGETNTSEDNPKINEYKLLKIESIPNGAIVKNKNYITIGNTPINLNKCIYLNEEVKIIFGIKVKTILVNDSVNDIFINFDNIKIKDNTAQPITPPPPPIPPYPPKKDNSTTLAIIGFGLVLVLVTFIIAKNHNLGTTTEYPEDDALVVDSAALVIDSAAVVVDSAAVYIDSAAVIAAEAAAAAVALAATDSDTVPTSINSTSAVGNNSASQITSSYFLGKWRDENSEFTFYSNGDYYIKWDDGSTLWTTWVYTGVNLYIGNGKNKDMVRHYFTNYNINYFSYAEDGGTTYNAQRVL